MLPDMVDKLLSTGEAAKALGISARSLSRWATERKVEPTLITPGGQFKWNLDELREQLKRWPDRRRRPRPGDDDKPAEG
jgi:hypothetical protein